MTPAAQLNTWRTNRGELEEASATLANDARVAWYGPSMGATSFLTARLMEVWAHGTDIIVGSANLTRNALGTNHEMGVHIHEADWNLVSAFEAFVGTATVRRVVGGDDAVAAAIGARTGADTVGTGASCTRRMVGIEPARSAIAFDLLDADGSPLGHVAVPVPGLHNARNAAVATVAGMAAGVPFDAAARALARFAGVARRFEFRGRAHDVTFVDDYAHLPTEVEAALAAAADGAWDRVVAVFQPHRYSRTGALWEEFGAAFADADVVVVTDVYGAGEAPVPGVSGRLVADAVRRTAPDKDVRYVAGRSELRDVLEGLLRPGDLCCTLGAGDLTSLPDELLDDPGW